MHAQRKALTQKPHYNNFISANKSVTRFLPVITTTYRPRLCPPLKVMKVLLKLLKQFFWESNHGVFK